MIKPPVIILKKISQSPPPQTNRLETALKLRHKDNFYSFFNISFSTTMLIIRSYSTSKITHN